MDVFGYGVNILLALRGGHKWMEDDGMGSVLVNVEGWFSNGLGLWWRASGGERVLLELKLFLRLLSPCLHGDRPRNKIG